MNKKKLSLVLILLIVVAISVGCLQQNPKEEDDINKTEKIPVETVLSRIETIYNERIFSGMILPKEQSAAISKLQGQISSIEVEVGDTVNVGDILFIVKGISSQMSQSIASQPRIIEEKVKASIDGIVSAVNITQGQMLSPSSLPMILVNLNELYVQTNVTGNIINKLKKGQKAKVIVDMVSQDALEGKIVQISPVADPRTQLYSIIIEVKNEGKLIKPGMFAEITVKTDVVENVIVIPSDTVIYRDDKTFVYVVENGAVLEKEVELGMDTGVLINVTKGLEKDEEVVTKGQNFIEEGTIVEVVRGDE